LVPFPVKHRVFQVGVALGRLDSAHRDTVADVFRVTVPAVCSPV
jgi:hypothetical protein